MDRRAEMKAVHARVRGRVQGVGFRHATVRAARDLGVAGWVRNDRDGSVEAWLQGDPEAVDRLVRFLRVGPMAATVHDVVATPGVVQPSLRDFDVRF